MRTLIVPMALVFGISLFGFFLVESPVTLGVSEVVVAPLLLYGIFRIRRVGVGPITYAVVLLALVILLANLANAVLDSAFSTGNFLANYARVISLVGMVVLFPTLFRGLGHDRLAVGTLWVVRLHCVILLIDSVAGLPDFMYTSTAVEGVDRPTGMFQEPAFFGTFVGLSLFYILQVERNRSRLYMRTWDIALAGIAIGASAGASGVFLFVPVVAARLLLSKRRARLGSLKGLALGLFLFVSILVIFPTSGPGWGIARLAERIPRILPELTDDSARSRFVGSWRFTRAVLEESPLIGVGLGGVNQEKAMIRYRAQLPYDPKEDVETVSRSSALANVVGAGGIFGAILFIFILVRLIALPQTRWMGIGLAFAGFVYGGAFEVVIWWFLALGVSQLGLRSRVTATKHTSPLGRSQLSPSTGAT